MKTNDNNYLSISEIGKILNITYQGALKKVRTNKELLKPYLILDSKKNIKGIKQEGLEELRNLPHRVSYASRVSQEESQQKALQEKELNNLQEVIKTKQAFIDELLKDKEELKAKVLSLETELNAYRNGGLFTRLLGYKKK